MRTTLLVFALTFGLAGCINVERSPAPAKTTVVVPPGSSTTVVCSNGAASC